MRCLLILLLTTAGLLTGCASSGKYTVDDGRVVNEALLADIRNYGAGERVLRPAIARSADLHDPFCDTQWELPFSVATSYDASADDRVAWVRALGVDERLTVVGTAPGSPLQLRDRIKSIGDHPGTDSGQMLMQLATMRDFGQPFEVKLFSGDTVKVKPFKACRGYARLAPPSSPRSQDYHWLLSVHPLQVSEVNMTEDEALWLVLWTQGLSEEGGARMKTYDYGTKIAGTLYNVFTIASGVKGAAMAADAAMRAAQSAAATAAGNLLKKQIIEQAAAAASARARSEVANVIQKQLIQQQAVNAMQLAASNRASLSGIAWVAATSFEKADTWAYTRLEQLHANPLAGFSLHQKLVEHGLSANSMVLDPERMKSLNKVAEAHGQSDNVVAILRGVAPEDLQTELADMPVASVPLAFSYESISETREAPRTGQPFSRGLIDGMLGMPVASSAAR